jgi:FSR family fosmidomycin resistance protein-like MFS transporter
VTSLPVLITLSLCHLLNDLLQALLPAIYPMLKNDFGLSFAQIGLITLTSQVTSSYCSPWSASTPTGIRSRFRSPSA